MQEIYDAIKKLENTREGLPSQFRYLPEDLQKMIIDKHASEYMVLQGSKTFKIYVEAMGYTIKE